MSAIFPDDASNETASESKSATPEETPAEEQKVATFDLLEYELPGQERRRARSPRAQSL